MSVTGDRPVAAVRRGVAALGLEAMDRLGQRSPARLSTFVLGLAVLGGAIARFGTLDLQSFSHDEAVTVVHVVQPGLVDTLSEVAERERNGPLYYALAWLWSLFTPSGEIGFRALPAIFGVLTIPVAALTASELASRRAGAIAALLVAANPFLIWYSQEARSYSLFVLLGALSLLFLARALNRPGRNTADLALWAAFSAGALASHYFALFVVLPAALWLVHELRAREAVAAVAATGLAGMALLPLALHQGTQRSGLFADTDLLNRLLESGAKFSAGNELSLFPELAGIHVAVAILSAVAGVAWATGIILAVREGRSQQGPDGRLAVGIGASALAIPVVLALAGLDLVNPRNLIGAVVPLLVGAACGLGARPIGFPRLATTTLLLLAFLANYALVTVDPSLQRRDFRGVAQQLGDPAGERLILTSRLGVPQLWLYADARRQSGDGLPSLASGEPVLQAVEVAVVVPAGGASSRQSADDPLPGLPAFRLAERRPVPGYDLLVYRAKKLTSVPFSALTRGPFGGPSSVVLGDGV